MTPPPFIRNFSLGFNHPQIGEAELRPAQNRLDGLLRAAAEQRQASTREQAASIDQFLVAPTLRYRPLTSEIFRQSDVAQMEERVPTLLNEARDGNRVRYYNLIQLHYGLLERAEPARVPALSQRVCEIAIEYAEFLRSRTEFPDQEKMMALYAGARMLHTYLAYLLSPPRALDFPERPATLNLLFSTLDSLDAELQRLHGSLRSAGQADIADYEGVARLIELRRRLRAGSPEDRRQAALDLAEELTLHPPPETPAENDWRSRAERALLDTPNAIGRLRSFDRPSGAEERAAAMNGLALETLEIAAATLDRANEESESVVMARYRDLGLVLSVAILRHPESTLEELLEKLQNPIYQADFVQEISQASANPALAGALREATTGRDTAALVTAARQAALHVRGLRGGIGAAILPILLEENRRHHPVARVATALERLPNLAIALHLPQAGTLDPVVQRRQAVELLRRGPRGLAEIDSFHRAHPEAPVAPLRQSLSESGELDGFTAESLNRLGLTLNRGRDHEIAALHGVFSALDRGEEIGAGLHISESSRRRARALVEQMGSLGFRAGRVVSHLTSRSSLLGLLVGVLATEFLPTLLIARAGTSGSLALGRIPLVTRGSLALPGSILTGVGTGAGMSLVGSSLHQWERSRYGLSTHWGRDLGTSLLVNTFAFGLTLPLSHLWNRALTPRLDATTPLTPMSAGRRFLLHGGNVAIGGLTTYGLGYVGRGLATGQWQTSAEEVAENFGSILMWEAGSAGVRALRRTRGYSSELGPYRQAEVERITNRILEMHGGLNNRRHDIQNHLAREELRYPGWLHGFDQRLQAGGHVPILEGSGRNERLLLVPESSLPPRAEPVAEPTPVIIVIGDNQRPALAAGSDAEVRDSVAPPPPKEAAATPDEAPARPRSVPPVRLAESPHYFRVQPDEAYGEPEGILHLGRGESSDGNFHWILGREHFHFLSPEARRVLSRAHLEIRSGAEGILSIRDLSTPQAGGLGEHHGTFFKTAMGRWERVPNDTYLLLTDTESLALGNISEPILMELRPNPSPAVAETLRVDTLISPISHPLQVTLASGQRQRFNGLILLRPGDHSTFHLGGPGNVEMEIVRSLGPQANVPQRTNAGMNPIIGEIGETTRITFLGENGRQEYRLILDDPDRPAAHLPTVLLDYHGNRRNLRFRPTEAELVFGRNFQADLFGANYISRRHFNLRVVSHEGQPRYLLTADSRSGLRIGPRTLNPNESILLYSGVYDLGFLISPNSPQGFDGPFQLHLPPIESTFPEWGTGPLLAGHDRNIPPPPPAPPPLPPTPPAPPPPAPRPWWRPW